MGLVDMLRFQSFRIKKDKSARNFHNVVDAHDLHTSLCHHSTTIKPIKKRMHPIASLAKNDMVVNTAGS